MRDYSCIYRTAAVFKPKNPFWNWVEKAFSYEHYKVEEIDKRDSHVYLLPETDLYEKLKKRIKDIYVDIFECELNAWCTDPSSWPKQMTWQIFQEWFDVELHTMILDTPDEEVQKD